MRGGRGSGWSHHDGNRINARDQMAHECDIINPLPEKIIPRPPR